MPKKVLVMILSLCMAILTGCGDTKEQTDNSTAETTAASEGSAQANSELGELEEKYPEYFQLNTFKGIELYVWETAEGCYCCGMLGGTNRVKNDEEIWDLFTKSVTPEEVRLILSTFPEDTFVDIIPVVQPLSSYAYEINDSYREKVADRFGVSQLCTTAGELTK